jgi:D-cysteine desulfhydrase family pyridoxal phosphate-dependent enzyme
LIDLDAIERTPLADLPTPLEAAPRLARHLGLARLLVKRDDRTGLALGGGKARKLEYDLPAALHGGHDVLLTVGGAQSNHAVLTAAAARRLGLDVKVVLGGPDFDEFRGNMLLSALLGVELRYLVDDDDNDALEAAMAAWAGELRAAGRRPFCLPIGGSTGRGALGYVRAMRELAAQLGELYPPVRPGDPLQIVVAAGSCGTLAGTIVGARLFLSGARVVGISVSRPAGAVARRTAELARECAALLDAGAPPSPADVECHDAFFEEYGRPTRPGREAMLLAARLEGLLLDPVYTGKAMAGLIALAAGGQLDRATTTVFIHTGGLPILFAHPAEVADAAPCTRR